MIAEAKRESDFSRSVTKSISENARDAQLATEIKLLQRQIRQRKEQFGTKVWDIVVEEGDENGTAASSASTTETKKKKSGLMKAVKGTVSKTLGKVAGTEQNIESCIIAARNDVRSLQETKRRKLSMIEGFKK